MLYCLLDGHARTSTELAIVAEVSPSTASVHLEKLRATQLVTVLAQGKHRYYSLAGPNVASALEKLSVLAGAQKSKFEPSTPNALRAARTCYDHIAGTLGVLLHDRFAALKWMAFAGEREDGIYELTGVGVKAFGALGVNVEDVRSQRRRFAFACVDWSERRPHLGGALGAAILGIALKRRWVVQNVDSRALDVTSYGRREMFSRFGARV